MEKDHKCVKRDSDDANGRGLEPQALKRQRNDLETVEDPSHNEPEEKRHAGNFKLNPPILIHGKAKPAPKQEYSSSKLTFLRPSTLSAPSQVAYSTKPRSSAFGPRLLSPINQVPVARGSLAISSTNPFLRTENEDEKDFEPTPKNPADEQNEDGEENSFLKLQSVDSSDNKKTNDEPCNFVFGSNMLERVFKAEADSTSAGTESSEFLFGRNLSDRVKVANVDTTKHSLLTTTSTESALFNEPTEKIATSNTSEKKLEENAAALFTASNPVVCMPEVETKTGEEDEKNVLQIQCKLHQYESNNMKNWVERGRGILRVNDGRPSSSDRKFQSRLVMRTNGSLRLILNTKIWATMTVDRASQKAVRISALNENGDIGVYLITATINDAEHLYRAIEYRRLHLKQLEDSAREESESCENETLSSEESAKSSFGPDDKNKDGSSEALVARDTATVDKISSPKQPESGGDESSVEGSCLKNCAAEQGDTDATSTPPMVSTNTDSVQNEKSTLLTFDGGNKALISKPTRHSEECR